MGEALRKTFFQPVDFGGADRDGEPAALVRFLLHVAGRALAVMPAAPGDPDVRRGEGRRAQQEADRSRDEPPRLCATSISSNESAEISTPAPKAITAAIKRCGMRGTEASAAPMTSAEPASRPQRSACT